MAYADINIKIVNTWKRKILRRVYGPVVERGIRGISTNQELQELYEDLGIAAHKKREYRHLVRLDCGRVVKKIFESKLE
jgi:hypothetical protein